MMIFNTASTMTIPKQPKSTFFLFSRIGLLIGFLIFHPEKMNFVKSEACAIIFITTSLVFKFIKEQNKFFSNVVYVAAYVSPFFFLLTKTFSKTRHL